MRCSGRDFFRRINAILQINLFYLLCTGVISCKDIERPPLYSLFLGSADAPIGIISSDFGAAGRFTLMSPESFALPGIVNIHSDASGRFFDGRVYIVNRLNRDNIQIVRPGSILYTEREISVGAGSNPHDIALITPNKAYVSLYNDSRLLILNPELGLLTGSVDLSAYAEATPVPDGLPEISALHAEGNTVYIAAQQLDRNDPSGYFPPAASSLLIELNASVDTTVNTHTFPASNPFGKPQRALFQGSYHLIFACPGRLGAISALDGGVVAFNLATKSFRPSLMFSEIQAGGDILAALIKNDTTGYAIVLDSSLVKTLQRFNPTSGLRTGILHQNSPTEGNLSGLYLAPDGRLYLGNADPLGSGIIIFDTNRGDIRLTPQPINIGLRPSDIIGLKDF